MTLAHGAGAARYDELVVVAVWLLVLVLALVQMRWSAKHRDQARPPDRHSGEAARARGLRPRHAEASDGSSSQSDALPNTAPAEQDGSDDGRRRRR